MPRKTLKESIVETIIEDAVQESIYMEELLDNDNTAEEVLDELEENIAIAMSCRRGIFDPVITSDDWRNNILPTMDDVRFRHMLRVDRDMYTNLVNVLKNDQEFNNLRGCKQYSVELQLAVVLFRLGSSGESAAYKKIGSIFGIGDGGTICNFTYRVFKAILSLQSKYIYWPNGKERSEIVSETVNELPFCIGYIDGTEIKLAESPIDDHVKYFSRSRIYALKAQVVCDHKLRIRHVVVGHPGSWHDARIYRNSSLFKKNATYFSPQQWIAGDSAYPLSTTLITPYRNNARQLTKNERIDFNLRHSRYRVRVEHCFGLLKERFGSLKELRMRIGTKESKKHACDWFLVCCILHNMVLSKKLDIECESIGHECSNEEREEFIPESEENVTNINGELKRQAIYSLIKN